MTDMCCTLAYWLREGLACGGVGLYLPDLCLPSTWGCRNEPQGWPSNAHFSIRGERERDTERERERERDRHREIE
jgi:hypothetical protein